MISLATLLAASILGQAGPDLSAKIVVKGGDHAPGILVNYTAGARPFDPINPSLPTVAVTHGLNPYHPVLHFAMAERYAESIGRKYGAGVNVVGWDWNAATMPSVRPSVIRQNAIAQGHAFGNALLNAGVDPASVHLVGQSSGCLTIAAAARFLLQHTGRRVGRISVLDPSIAEHPLLFDELDVVSTTNYLEHIWVPGASGFSCQVDRPGVNNLCVPGPRGVRGLFNPLHLDHLYAIGWHARELGR
ncbi:hypothetical protein [Singulisphaera sp. PoT]|uniref:hypothetical protein n=1 Tax=Singulisphaera sp. PoT TaxID=3411797 RepID=UPI003BF5FBC9